MQKALAISADDRYQTAGELNEALTRCAHRHGLLIAAPELARELLEACGPTDGWRDDNEDEDFGYAEGKRAGTEVYDAADDEEEVEEEEDLGIGPVSIHSIALARASSKDRLSRPKTEVGKFAGVELTSIINMMDLEAEGAKPLVDLNVGPVIPNSADSGQRILDSGPQSHMRGSAPDGSEMRSNAPRALPPSRQPYPPELGPRIATPAPPKKSRTRRSVIPWMVIAASLLAGAIAAIIVAMSGPDVSGP